MGTGTAPSSRRTENLQGHWLLARIGKRVLRPGGLELTRTMLEAAAPAGRRVVEFAPGLGVTAALILEQEPASYTGVERDQAALAQAQDVVGGRGDVLLGEAHATGLPSGCADLVVGEAMLTMQSDDQKLAIMTEARRLLEPGGRYAIHELGLRPDNLDSAVKGNIRKELATAIKVNARPLTMAEWSALLEQGGFDVEWTDQVEMALLEPRRLVQDEGIRGVVRILVNVVRDADARRRVLSMRRTFRSHRDSICAVSLVARAR